MPTTELGTVARCGYCIAAVIEMGVGEHFGNSVGADREHLPTDLADEAPVSLR